MTYLPFHGGADQAAPELVSLVTEIVGSPSIAEFLVGRTRDIASVRDAHGCNHLFVLYSSDGPDDAIQVERTLARAFASHAKRVDAAARGDGEPLAGYGHYVYVAVWLKM